jgi:hypothetical protein
LVADEWQDLPLETSALLTEDARKAYPTEHFNTADIVFQIQSGDAGHTPTNSTDGTTFQIRPPPPTNTRQQDHRPTITGEPTSSTDGHNTNTQPQTHAQEAFDAAAREYQRAVVPLVEAMVEAVNLQAVKFARIKEKSHHGAVRTRDLRHLQHCHSHNSQTWWDQGFNS